MEEQSGCVDDEKTGSASVAEKERTILKAGDCRALAEFIEVPEEGPKSPFSPLTILIMDDAQLYEPAEQG